MDQSPQVKLNTTAHYFLEGLNELGIEYLFCNLGTDHAPLVEEMARWRKHGRRPPQVILCPHENVAIHMAAGYAMATGRGQGVMVHVDVGTANSAVGMHEPCRARTPALVMAGRAPFTSRGELTGSRDTYVHFVQEPFDQAGIVRPYVKWEYSLPVGVVAKEVLRRAHSVMQTDPRGPVYLMLPRRRSPKPGRRTRCAHSRRVLGCCDHTEWPDTFWAIRLPPGVCSVTFAAHGRATWAAIAKPHADPMVVGRPLIPQQVERVSSAPRSNCSTSRSIRPSPSKSSLTTARESNSNPTPSRKATFRNALPSKFMNNTSCSKPFHDSSTLSSPASDCPNSSLIAGSGFEVPV